MTKRFITIFALLVSSTIMFAQSLHGWGQDLNPDSNLGFWNNDMNLVLFGDPPITITTKYSESIINNIHYIDFSFPAKNQELLPIGLKGSNKWLIIFNDELLFSYINDTDVPINNGFLGRNRYRIVNCDFISTSSLIENTTSYPASNLGLLTLRKPWVEGVSGYGIEESITITCKNNKTYIKELLISIGFVSFTKPNLYEENSRPKTIEISTEDGIFNFNITLIDTPNLQLIKLPKAVTNVIITIKDIYKGNKWDDTCINYIIPLM